MFAGKSCRTPSRARVVSRPVPWQHWQSQWYTAISSLAFFSVPSVAPWCRFRSPLLPRRGYLGDKGQGGRLDPQDPRTKIDLTPAGGQGGGDLLVGEPALGTDGQEDGMVTTCTAGPALTPGPSPEGRGEIRVGEEAAGRRRKAGRGTRPRAAAGQSPSAGCGRIASTASITVRRNRVRACSTGWATAAGRLQRHQSADAQLDRLLDQPLLPVALGQGHAQRQRGRATRDRPRPAKGRPARPRPGRSARRRAENSLPLPSKSVTSCARGRAASRGSRDGLPARPARPGPR